MKSCDVHLQICIHFEDLLRLDDAYVNFSFFSEVRRGRKLNNRQRNDWLNYRSSCLFSHKYWD